MVIHGKFQILEGEEFLRSWIHDGVRRRVGGTSRLEALESPLSTAHSRLRAARFAFEGALSRRAARELRGGRS